MCKACRKELGHHCYPRQSLGTIQEKMRERNVAEIQLLKDEKQLLRDLISHFQAKAELVKW